MNSKSISIKIWAGPLARSLQDVYGFSRSPVTLFIDKANEIRSVTSVKGPAFNPFCYAERLGIVVEQNADMALDGVLRRLDNGQFVISLRERTDRRRKNFTLAHEISHTFFYEILHHRRNPYSSEGVDEEEERLCDVGATELLMPAVQFRSDIMSDDELTPKTLFRLVESYDVSLEAVANRVAKLMNVACAFWEKDQRRINLKQIVPRYVKPLLCQTGHSSVERAFETPGEVIIGNDSFYGVRSSGRIRRQAASLGLPGNRAISILFLGDLSSVP